MSDGGSRGAAFLDRDGTIIDDAHYIADPELGRLRPGAAEAIVELNRAMVPVIVVTNQSGMARGLITESAYRSVEARLAELLASRGARIDATYVCPPQAGYPALPARRRGARPRSDEVALCWRSMA